LCHIKRDRITFSILVKGETTVRIGAIAWPAVVRRLKTFEIIDVHVKPAPKGVDGPPDYDVAVGDGIEKDGNCCKQQGDEGLNHLSRLK
jgi:hypothetical protein